MFIDDDDDDDAKLFKHVRSAEDSAVLQKSCECVIDCFSGRITGC